MRVSIQGVLALGVIMAGTVVAGAAGVSVERGAQVAITGGCHDCHTVGYVEMGGKVDPSASLKGSPLGWQGPWGTTYAANLRLVAVDHGDEDGFVEYLKTFEVRPPMPFSNVHAMDESDTLALSIHRLAG